MIRNATDADLLQIVKVHSICFPNSFSTKLGSGRELILLQKFYKEYLDVVPELFFVALNNENRIIGFCMGYYCNSNNFQRDFIMHNLLSISIKMFSLLMSGNKLAWRRILPKLKTKENILNERYIKTSLDKKADILSIAVLPQFRGSGVAVDLIKRFEETVKLKGKKYCQLSVESNNTRGIHFYEKMEYMKCKESEGSITYYKPL